MEIPDRDPVEDFAQALAALKDQFQVSDSDIARAIGVSSAAVGTWVHRQRKPRRESIEALAAAYPAFGRDRLFRAAERETPGPVAAEARERLMALFEELTAEQQEMKEIEMQALAERNRSKFS